MANRILDKMLERLFAALVNGPSLNCRPHSSRQRVDWTFLARLRDVSPEEGLRAILGPQKSAKWSARATPSRRAMNGRPEEELSPEEKSERQAWSDQLSLLAKLRGIVEDARTYEQDTGVQVLNIGFPLLSLAAGAASGVRRGGTSRRIIAPVAFIPVNVAIKSGAAPGVHIACKGEGVDRVTPNTALLAWLERQTGKPAAGELFADEEGSNPWREISELVRHVCTTLEMSPPEAFTSPTALETLALKAAPRADELEERPAIISSAVLGLFPMANQGLLRDMQAMAGGEPVSGPVTSFIQANVSLDAMPEAPGRPETPTPLERQTRVFGEERLIAQADPCQARAVRMARKSRGLVIHGPPGTGKSQTITNIIGDHLARGERVLLVSDKRTALDVVANRLEHMGLRGLVALIHDPQRDQRDLYRSIREQLESLTDSRTSENAARQLSAVDAELQEVHRELTEFWDALMKHADGDSFHDLVGRWLALSDSEDSARLEGMGEAIAPRDLKTHAHPLEETASRAVKIAWWTNPWRDAAGTELSTFLATPMDKWRGAMAGCEGLAAAADATRHPEIPPFEAGDLRAQGAARTQLAAHLREVLEQVDADVRTRWAQAKPETAERAGKRLAEVDPQLRAMTGGGALDGELAMIARERMPTIAQLAAQLGALESYLQIAGAWHAFLHVKRKAAARDVVAKYGLALSPQSARRMRDFLAALRVRLVLQAVHYELYQLPVAPAGLLSDEVIERTLAQHTRLFALLAAVRATLLAEPIRRALADAAAAQKLLSGLDAAVARADALAKLEESLLATKLFDRRWLPGRFAAARRGAAMGEEVAELAGKLEDVERVLRVRAGLARLPNGLADGLKKLLTHPVEVPTVVGALTKVALAAEIARRLSHSPRLQDVDAHRVSSLFDRCRKLESTKRELVRQVILHQWTSRQKERLLASTGSRLGALGAELKRRLTLRGERAMRLRQVLATGQKTEGGDPMFDARPVWMASPETVAQLFERKEVFSVVIFDEASQCRLEETLPVLTRGGRVVIAGDPQQLPPTRFFESAIAQSDDGDEIETDQQLFEAQQGEIEDLLAAALNLEIDRCYLDVHYRSRSADLIEFSNAHFYKSRLQPIPGHPANKPPGPPLVLHAVGGVYEKRENHQEAQTVVRLVRELLDLSPPPSIGVACFNLQQRDLIVEKLDEAAAQDEAFAAKLAAARARQGTGSFEGLFVKNLENVQGDERDRMIISTTYGPDASGRFYRRFGPLGRAGGGRRLNVLVTRAREFVHLVTSIPAEVYRALPPIPDGRAPTGGWLLFSYLKYAEDVARVFERQAQRDAEPAPAADAASDGQAIIRKLPTGTPSLLAESLAQTLADRHHLNSDLYWGNDGFLIDVALWRGERSDDMTLGVLCDASRFANAQDPVEWDIFRTAIHESQGWRLHRVWSPHLFRDLRGATRAILAQAGSAPVPTGSPGR
jgi:hypothetical protein